MRDAGYRPAAAVMLLNREGKVWVADDFDEPLPPEILEGFEGKG